MNLVANIIAWFVDILLDVVKVIVSILSIFTGTNITGEKNTPLFLDIIKGLNSAVISNTSILSIATVIFVAILGINIFQEVIHSVADSDMGLEKTGFAKVLREGIVVMAVLVVYTLLFTGAGVGWSGVGRITEVSMFVSKTAASSLVNSISNVAANPEIAKDIFGSAVEGAAVNFVILLMAFGLIMGMINCIAQLVSTFVIGLVSIVMGILVLPIHISMGMLGKNDSAGKAMLTVLNAIVLIGVVMGMGQAIVNSNGMQALASSEATTQYWQKHLLSNLIYFGMLEGYKTLVQRANGFMTDMLANIFRMG